MKKFAALFVSFVCVMTNMGLSLPAHAAGTGTLTFSPTTEFVKTGDSFTVAVMVNPNGASLDTIRVELSYDPTKLSATVFKVGALFPNLTPAYSINNSAGIVSFGAYKFGPSVTTSGTFGIVTFRALASGTSTISLLNTSKLIQDGTETMNVDALGTVTVTTDGVGKVSPSPHASPVATLIHDPSKYNELLAVLGLTSKPSDFAKYKPLVKSDALAFKVNLTEAQQMAIANFVTYGASAETVKLGAGERRAVIRDYFETVGRSDVNWDDIQRISTGQKLMDRNLAKEQSQVTLVLAKFKLMVGHTPNFKVPAEDIAWNTMMYRIRFPRDMSKEGQGIVKFKKIFKHAPISPMEWSMVRALGYAL